MKPLLAAIVTLPPDDQHDAVVNLAKALVANGVTKADLAKLTSMVGKLKMLTEPSARLY
jgi:hypothetical protein